MFSEAIEKSKCILSYESLFWGLLSILSTISEYRGEDGLVDGTDNSQVQVRAVFIDCEINEKKMTFGTDTLRFQREELFKHNALRDCKKKLALTVKMSSGSSANQPMGDEYIPIEHVFDGPNKKRVRLLNPYILRLQREPTFETYKLRKIDTFSGLLTTSSEKIQQIYEKESKKRNRHTDQSSITTIENDQRQICSSKTTGYLRRKKRLDINSGKQQSFSLDNILNWNLDGQYTSSNAMMEGAPMTRQMDFLNNIKHDSIYKSILGEPSDALNDNDAVVINDNVNIKSYEFNNNEGTLIKKNRNQHFKTNLGLHKLSNTRQTYNNEGDIGHSLNDLNSLNGVEKEFVLYEIGSPDIWFRAQVQLLEKLSTSDGKTVWRDITQQEARISSNYPEWKNQDVNIRYRCADWVPSEDFTLPSIGFGLLLPRDGRINNNFGTDEFGEFLIVPYEDIETEKNKDLNKREDISNANVMLSGVSKPLRRVSVRVSRALFGRSRDNYMIVGEGRDQYLRIPFNKPHHAQIDLEAKADENELVYVGSSGRLTTAVSENTRRSRTTLSIQMTNTGLAAARFRPKIRDCVPKIMKKTNENIEVDPVLIPPMHSSRFSLELPVEVPVDGVHCSVVMSNDADESVAVREVKIKRGDRCFCVWHCQCVCMDEDPKLLCQEMPEYEQVAAGLTLRESPRQVRAACYPDVVTVNLLVVAFGVIFFLLALGFVKACLGLLLRCVGSWGIDQLIQTPRKLDHYYEIGLRSRAVVYDKEGWPVHPDSRKRTVRLISRPMEFILNLIFFIILPCLVLWHCLKTIMSHCQKKKNNNNIYRGNTQKNSSPNIQLQVKKALLRRKKQPHMGWMSPPAEELSTDIWRNGFASQGFSQPKCMRPLLRDERYRGKMCEGYPPMDSDHEDTEYVLLQMKKSKESLAVRNFKFQKI